MKKRTDSTKHVTIPLPHITSFMLAEIQSIIITWMSAYIDHMLVRQDWQQN